MKKAVAYARVSSKEQEREGYSIPAQIKLVRNYAAQKGLRLVRIFREAETAKRSGRKEFSEMLAFLSETPDCRDVLVEKTDRLYRNFRDFVELDPDTSDLRIHFVKEGTILDRNSRSSEKFVHGIKVLMAKNYLDNLSEEVKKGQRQKASQGIWPSSAPIGYLNRREDHTIIPDPDRAPLVTRAFELAATGQYSLSKLSDHLFRMGLRSVRAKRKLTKQSMACVLRNPIYYGCFVWKDRTYEGKHQPLISFELFQRVQHAMGFVQKPRLTKHDFSFSGMLTCGHCGCSITAERKIKKSGRQYVYYHCTNGRGVCDNVVYLREERIEDAFSAALQAIEIPDEVVEWTRRALVDSGRDEQRFRDETIKRLSRRYRKLDRYIAQAYEDRLEGTIELDLWERKSGEWKQEQSEVLVKIEALKSANTQYIEDGLRLMELAQNAHELFRKLQPDEKREMLGLVLSNPQVMDGKVRYSYKMPFSMFAEIDGLTKWRGRRDSNSRPPA